MELIASVCSCADAVGKCLLPDMEKHVSFLYKYKKTLKSLEDEAKRLEAMMKDADSLAEDIKRQQQDVLNVAALWQANAKELHENATKILSRNISLSTSISCLHPWSHYSTCKQAWETAHRITKEMDSVPDFSIGIDRPTPKSDPDFGPTGFMEFESRESVVDDVLKAFKNENVRICSICGMGGTGKTTLAKKLLQRVKGEYLFDEVAMVTVSQTPNAKTIRDDIVSSLGWKIDSTPRKLKECLLNKGESILLILDDVWGKLDFEEFGLPREKLRILFTSRSVTVCESMGSQSNFVIEALSKEEARGMFKQITMKSIEKLKLHDTARNIADECGGLPIVIVTLSTALNNEIEATWNDTLLKLRTSSLLNMSEMEQVFSRMRLSYDLLKDEEVQTLFRLCCLFPDDSGVPVDHLVVLGEGLHVFKGVKSMSETRTRVESIISKLKKSFFLLDGVRDGSVKMHDILRDFAISISSKDNPYIVGCEEDMEKWPESDQYENCSAISIVCNKIQEHRADLSCPKLELLQLIVLNDNLNGKPVGLPIGFFDGMTELKVLILVFPSLLLPLTMPSKLRTLGICERSLKRAARCTTRPR